MCNAALSIIQHEMYMRIREVAVLSQTNILVSRLELISIAKIVELNYTNIL